MVSMDGITSTDLGVNGASTDTQANSSLAIGLLDIAFGSLNNMRSEIGAYVNRLDHAISNIANQHYNTQDAESRIRDVDFATETTEFTKSQILSQSSMSMLSQANSIPSSVLQLLG